MSSRTVVLALVTAILLAGVAMLVVSLPSSKSASPSVPVGDRVLDIDTGRLASIAISIGGRTDRIVAGKVPGSWQLEPAGAVPGTVWSLDPARVRELVRLLSETRAIAEPAPGAGIDSGGATVTITYDDKSVQTLRVSPRTLAGQGLIAVSGSRPGISPSSGSTAERLALVADSLHSLLAGPGPRAWRERVLLPGVASGASRVRLINRTGGLALARVGGRWSLTEPVASAADPAAVTRLLATLEAMQAVRFYDESIPDSATGLDSPDARIIIESDLASTEEGANNPRINTTTREVAIGGPADASGRNLFAAMDQGRTLVSIDAAALSKLRLDPAKYIPPGATATAPADVGLVMLAMYARDGTSPREKGWRRTADGWVELRPDGQQVLLRPNDAAEVNGLIAFIATAAPVGIVFETPMGYEPLAAVKIAGHNVEPLDELELATTSGPQGGFIIRSGRVYRLYAAAPPAIDAFLGDALRKPAAKSAGNSGSPDPNK